MKHIITTAILLILTQRTFAQITLDYSNDSTYYFGDFFAIDISDNESKYFFPNYQRNSFSLFNMDMTLFMEVMIPQGMDSIKNGFRPIYITRTLFDCDSTNIEYAYENPLSVRAPFRILRTDGTVLLKVDSTRGPYSFGPSDGGAALLSPIRQTSDGAKLFLDKMNPWGTGIKIYSLCGDLPGTKKVYDTTQVTINDTNSITIYDTAHITVYDTFLTQINDTTVFTIYDTIVFTIYDSISVSDTLVINVNLSGLPPDNLNTIKVYPNPTLDYIYIDNGNYALMSGYSLKISNDLGQIVFQSSINQQQFHIDLNAFGGAGTYFLSISNPQSQVVELRKIILQ